MKAFWQRTSLSIALLICAALLFWTAPAGQAQEQNQQGSLYGRIIDAQNQPVAGVQLTWQLPGSNPNQEAGEHPADDVTQPDGSFRLSMPDFALIDPDPELSIRIERAHFESQTITLTGAQIQDLQMGEPVELAEIVLERQISPAFWIATVVFAGVLILIATDRLHNTLAALVGAALVLIISYLGPLIHPDLYIFDFAGSIRYIDWNVIFLIMGMMIVIAVVENTGIFQWLSFFAYRISGGRIMVLLAVLMLITGVASAFLDNVTTMLLMTPITIQIAITIGINPLALLIPEVMASNVIGISTLIGTPTNILIGSYANISFSDFMVNLTPGVLMAFIGLLIYSALIYRKELAEARTPEPLLLKRLAERGKIREPGNLKKAGWIGLGMLLLFILGEQIHLLPSVTALVGATALMVWIQPDIEEMIEAVDWTTLVFFMALFMVVGGIQEVGLISLIAQYIGQLVGSNLVLAILAIIWLSAILSMVVANIPFTAAMLPVVGFLSATVPGAEGKILFYCLSVGSALGGNGSLIGASANMITAGIAERSGYPISYVYFFKKGFPALLITVGLATLWLLIKQ